MYMNHLYVVYNLFIKVKSKYMCNQDISHQNISIQFDYH